MSAVQVCRIRLYAFSRSASELYIASVASTYVLSRSHPQRSLTATVAALSNKMPSSTILQAACFAVGALVGGGVVTAVESRRRAVPLPPQPTTSTRAPGPPIVEVQQTGTTRMTIPNALVGIDSPVLKHGNPGPISDMLVRKAYVAAYDRRLRHPAWVRLYCSPCHSGVVLTETYMFIRQLNT